MIDDSRIGASIPHPSADAGGAVAASELAPSAISFPRHVEAASPFGAGGGGSAGGLSGAPSSVGRGGGNGGSSATALTGAHETPSANAASASARRQPARVECPHRRSSPAPDDVSGHISRRRRHPTIRRWLSARRIAHAPQWTGLVRPRLSRNPIPESTAFNIATRRPENNFFGWPHHKHVTLATLSGLPQAEQTFTCRIEGFFPRGSKLNAPSAQMLP
jgi:hypothetical protein